MNIKSLLLGSAAALVAATGAQAADVIVAPEPEAVEYVRVCDAYGAGYFYIPGTETCLRIHGYMRYDVKAGDDAYDSRELGGWKKRARFTLRTSTASETELGTLKTYTETRFQWDATAGEYFDRRSDEYGTDTTSTKLQFGYIQLGGLKVGLDESEFLTFTGYLGDILNDDVVYAGNYRTGKISYTFSGGNGFSAVLALEEGGDGYVINDYVPHIVGGLKYAQGWGSIAAVAAYDSVIEEWSAKARLDVNLTDQFSAWVQGGYASDETDDQMYGAWGGDWAVWGGLKYKATEKATFNIQAAYEDWGKTAIAANVAYQIVPGFTITPEVSYTKWDSDHPLRDAAYAGNDYVENKDAWQAMIRFQRSF